MASRRREPGAPGPVLKPEPVRAGTLVPASYDEEDGSFMFFVGAVIGYGFEKAAPEKSKEYLFPVASGIIAGDSLMAVAVNFARAALGIA